MAKCQCDPVPLGWDKTRATYTPEIDGVERCRKCQLPIAEPTSSEEER